MASCHKKRKEKRSKPYVVTKKERKKIVFPTKKELAEAMAEYTASLSAKFCKERGYFTVVLSGGDLISWLSELLERMDRESIEWSKWHIFWVDERVVPLDDKDINYKLAADGFLSKVPIPIANIYAIDQNCAALGDAKGAALLYEECLKRLVNQNIIRTYKSLGFPQFDLQLLGMGPDGHMASLFPGHYQIKDKANLVTYITNSPKMPPKRITFTLPVINCASCNLMAVCDEAQADAVAEVFNDNFNLPAAWLTADEEAIWLLDQAAASKIPKGHIEVWFSWVLFLCVSYISMVCLLLFLIKAVCSNVRSSLFGLIFQTS